MPILQNALDGGRWSRYLRMNGKSKRTDEGKP